MVKMFKELFERDVPLLDIRAPIEYSVGAFPNSRNLPILTNEERHQVGLIYKAEGQRAAEDLGFKLVTGPVRAARVQNWISFIEDYPETHLYCWRGGKRSEIACQWLSDLGYTVPLVAGGYKALRKFLLEKIERPPPFILIGGNTGSGKTELILKLSGGIDLEGIASHRGSAFGKRALPQPSQITFENAVAVQLIKNQAEPIIILEDEGRLIGRIQIPLKIKTSMDNSPVVVLEAPKEHRIERILNDYVICQYKELSELHGTGAFKLFSDQMLTATDAIRRRLGGERHREVRALMEKALFVHSEGNLESHREWIDFLLSEYYDPMYAYQMKNKSERILFSGTSDMIQDWLRNHYFSY